MSATHFVRIDPLLFNLITLVEAFDYSCTHLLLSVILSVLDSKVHSSVLFSSVHSENHYFVFQVSKFSDQAKATV